MAGWGFSVKRGLHSDSALIVLVLALLLLCTNSWAWSGCRDYRHGVVMYGTQYAVNCFLTLPSCGWSNDGTCFTSGYANGLCLCSSLNPSSVCPQTIVGYLNDYPNSGNYVWVNPVSVGGGSPNCSLYPQNCIYTIGCSTQAEADSVVESLKPVPPDSCKDRACCESANQTSPAPPDSNWLGCVAKNVGQGACQVFDSQANSGDTAYVAECDGLSEYEVCAEQWVWSQSASQCGAIPTRNCTVIRVEDSRCSDVTCFAYQEHSIGVLDYNGSTGCYEGTEEVQNILQCSNGTRGDNGSYTRPFKVCDSYLDSLGVDLSTYLAGGTGPGLGSGGLGAGGGSSSVGANGMSGGYQGGTSVDNEGNEVENSASPGLGGYTQGQQQYVTEYDSTTGETVIVKNSSGGDSMVTVQTFHELRCIGESNGIVTLTNGTSTWTCEALSCSQALMSARINGGACAPGASSSPYSGTSGGGMPNISYDSAQGGSNYKWYMDVNYPTYGAGVAGIVAAINALPYAINEGSERNLDSLTELWKSVFGDDLNNVYDIKDSLSRLATLLASASSENSDALSAVVQAITSASSRISDDISVQTSNVNVRISAAASTIASATSTASYEIRESIGSVTTSITSAASSIVSATSQYHNDVTTIVRGLDNYHNFMHDSIVYKMDSGFSVNLNAWHDDLIGPMVQQSVGEIVEHIDSLKIDVVHDSILDTINANLSRNTFAFTPSFIGDTIRYGQYAQDAYDSSFVDTSYVMDSSYSQYMRSMADSTIDGGDMEDTWVDSVEATIPARLDSAREANNARSDSLVDAYRDSIMKYYGIDSIGDALRDFFDQSGGCPTECLTITISASPLTGNRQVTIDLSEYICDMDLFGGHNFLEFVALILKILTAWFCMSMLVRMLPMGRKK